MLKVKVVKIRNILVGVILEQDNDKPFDVFTASNGFKIESVWSPAFGTDTLYIRGNNKEKDDLAFTRDFASCSEARKYLKKVRVAVAEFNRFNQEEPTTEQGDIISEVLS